MSASRQYRFMRVVRASVRSLMRQCESCRTTTLAMTIESKWRGGREKGPRC